MAGQAAHPKRRQRAVLACAAAGFTLLELLLAVAITGIVASVLYASLAIAFNARDAATQEVERVQGARMAMQIIQGDLENAARPVGILAQAMVGQNETNATSQPADTLRYITTQRMMPAGPTMGDLVRVELVLAEDPDAQDAAHEQGKVLLRQVQRNLLASVEPVPTAQILLRRVHAFNVRYYDGSDWQDTWDSDQQGNELPVAIELTLERLPEGVLAQDPQLQDKLIHVRQMVLPTLSPTAAQLDAALAGGGG